MNKINNEADVMNNIDSIIEQISEHIRETSPRVGFIRSQIIKTEIINTNILWIKLLLYDNDPLPLTVDILKDIYTSPIKNIYTSPGSGINTEANFITPRSRNVAIYLVNKGYNFIGVSPREDNAPSLPNYGPFKDWGLQKHSDDFYKVITLFQNILYLDYDVLGHSGGALTVLNYASKTLDNKLKVVRVIDMIGSYSPNSQEFINSQTSRDATIQLMNRGKFADTDILGIRFLVQSAQSNPTGDSGFPRPVGGGNFTNEGLLYYALIHSNQLPGPLTGITGLSSSWYFKQGYLSGTYTFGNTPIDDTYNLTHTNIQTIYSLIATIGSGIYPMAFDRDIFAAWCNSFQLIFEDIKVPIFYINTELGFGDAAYTLSLLKNSNVTYSNVSGYGHADPTFSDTAEIDFWNILVP